MDNGKTNILEVLSTPIFAKPCDTSTLITTIQKTFQISTMSARSLETDNPPTIFDETVDLEQFLLLLTQGMISSVALDIKSRLTAVLTRLTSIIEEVSGVYE